MIEVYKERCIPIFFDGPFAANNNFSCNFLNVASTQTAYFITHDDRPPNSPECCIIGYPFHPPHPTFMKNFTDFSTQNIQGVQVDWGTLTYVIFSLIFSFFLNFFIFFYNLSILNFLRTFLEVQKFYC